MNLHIPVIFEDPRERVLARAAVEDTDCAEPSRF
jgi:hypothetical protein